MQKGRCAATARDLRLASASAWAEAARGDVLRLEGELHGERGAITATRDSYGQRLEGLVRVNGGAHHVLARVLQSSTFEAFTSAVTCIISYYHCSDHVNCLNRAPQV